MSFFSKKKQKKSILKMLNIICIMYKRIFKKKNIILFPVKSQRPNYLSVQRTTYKKKNLNENLSRIDPWIIYKIHRLISPSKLFCKGKDTP